MILLFPIVKLKGAALAPSRKPRASGNFLSYGLNKYTSRRTISRVHSVLHDTMNTALRSHLPQARDEPNLSKPPTQTGGCSLLKIPARRTTRLVGLPHNHSHSVPVQPFRRSGSGSHFIICHHRMSGAGVRPSSESLVRGPVHLHAIAAWCPAPFVMELPEHIHAQSL